MADNYPKFRDDSNLGVFNFTEVRGFEQGRPDRIARRTVGNSRMCKAICAANNIRNPMALRDSVRLYKDTVYNELYMKGLRGEELETEYENIINTIEVTPEYWLGYDNLFNGVISEVTTGRMLITPTLNGMLEWVKKYDNVTK